MSKKATQAPATALKGNSEWKNVWRRFLRNKFAVVGLIMLSMLIIMSITAPLYVDYDLAIRHTDNRLVAPCAEYIFGTNEYGQDNFARIIYGSRVSLLTAFASMSFALVVGVSLGAVAGYYGGIIEGIIMRCVDVLLSLPSILLAITIVAAFGSSTINLIVAIAISDIAVFARVVRASVITVKDTEYVEAARAIGANDAVIIFKHIMPNCLGPIVVQSTLRVARVILTISSLSFIGLGISPPTPEWGNMLAAGRGYMRDYSYLVLYPGMAIMFTILSLNLLGDGLRDALDPRLK